MTLGCSSYELPSSSDKSEDKLAQSSSNANSDRQARSRTQTPPARDDDAGDEVRDDASEANRDRANTRRSRARNSTRSPRERNRSGDNDGSAKDRNKDGNDDRDMAGNDRVPNPRDGRRERDRGARNKEAPERMKMAAAFPDSSGDVGLKKGNLIPEITGEDLEGTEFKLSDYKGKVIMLDFWGDW